ncbi:MAG: peptidoglycan DD-metalloendopeptidase family protein [Rhodocyclaceae bacterium]|nr:peptidoglycan DD-metalloendopeptidase family protein [Rhodocyclaceae bacterium]
MLCRSLILVVFACVAQVIHAADAVSHPGGVLRVPVGVAASPPPEVRFQGNRVLVHPLGTAWEAVVGIPLDTSPGWESLEIRTADGVSRALPFTIEAYDYPVQHLRVPNKRHVNPTPEDLARYAREREAQDIAKRAWREALPTRVALDLPVSGRRSSAFGLRRTFNGEPRNPHSGLDLAVPVGTPVRAPAAGRVTLSGDYFFNGRTLFIDHGQGLISMLCHLSKFDVALGDEVAAGAVIARSGATGRATGPHVHWSVFLNGTSVDPEALVARP